MFALALALLVARERVVAAASNAKHRGERRAGLPAFQISHQTDRHTRK